LFQNKKRSFFFNTKKLFGSKSLSLSNRMIDYQNISTGYISSKDLISDNGEANSATSYKLVDDRNYKLKIVNSNGTIMIDEKNIELRQCGRYTLIIFPQPLNLRNLDYILLKDVRPTKLHVSLQFFQIFLMSIGEILFIVSSMNYAYSQAPASMKSLMQSAFILTVANGNLIVIIIAGSKFIENQVYEYIFFAGLLAIAGVIFLFIIWFDKRDENKNKTILIDMTSNVKTG
jgi:hypothetical protein